MPDPVFALIHPALLQLVQPGGARGPDDDDARGSPVCQPHPVEWQAHQGHQGSVLFLEQVGSFQCDHSDHLADDYSFENRWTTHYIKCTFGNDAALTGTASRFRSYAGDCWNLEGAKSMNYDGSSFTSRIIPTVTSVSHSSGSDLGGHLLTVKGHSWIEGKTSFKIVNGANSANCVVESLTLKDELYEAKCRTEAGSATSGSFFTGGHGWNVKAYEGISNLDTLKSWTIWYNSELPINDSTHGSAFTLVGRTYFKAPATGSYKFWASQDDNFVLYINDGAPNACKTDMTSGTTKLLEHNGAVGWHSIFNAFTGPDAFTRRSAAVSLTADQYYCMEYTFKEGGGGDHLTLGMEMTRTATTAHGMTRPEIQLLKFTGAHTPDEYKVRVKWGADHSTAKTFDLKFHYTDSNNNAAVKDITAIDVTTSAADFKTKVDSYFTAAFSSNEAKCKVTRNIYGEDGTTAAADDDSAHFVEYVIKMLYPRATEREESSKLPEISGTPDNSVTYTRGGKGYKGKFKVTLTNPSGESVEGKRDDLTGTASAGAVQWAIWNAVPEYYYKVWVTRQEVKDADDFFQGYQYIIKFTGYRANIPQINLASNEEDAFGIDEDPAPTVTFDGSTLLEPGSNNSLFFFPIPYSMFYTPHEKPQLTVTVDGAPGTCEWSSDTTCDYEFASVAASITAQTSSSPFTTVTVTGTGLPTTAAEISADFAGDTCAISNVAADGTGFTCTITSPVAGSHSIKARSAAAGEIKHAGTTAIEVVHSVTGATPSTIYTVAGLEVTITGTLFPTAASPGTQTVAATIGGQACTGVTLVSSTQMKCSSPAGLSAGTATLKVTINGKEVTKADHFTVTAVSATIALSDAADGSTTVTGLRQTKKQTLYVKVTGVSHSMTDLTKWDIYLVKGDKTHRMRANTVTGSSIVGVRYPGTEGTGDHTLKVVYKDIGLLGEATVKVGPTITSISPVEGSIAGGTLLTITGTLFEKGNTLFKLGTKDCVIESENADATEYKCRTTSAASTSDSTTDVVALVALQEESLCALAGGAQCNFNHKDSLTPKVTNAVLSGTDAPKLTITGSGFSTTTANNKVFLGGLEQTVEAGSTATSLSVAIDKVPSLSQQESLKVRVTNTQDAFALIASGKDQFHLKDVAFTYTALSPAEGSRNGQVITLTGTNFPANVAGAKLKQGSTTLCDDSFTFVSHTSVTCKTGTGAVTQAATSLEFPNDASTVTSVACATCLYETKDAKTPEVTGITLGAYESATETVDGASVTYKRQLITLAGTNFPASGTTVVNATFTDGTAAESGSSSGSAVTLKVRNGVGYGSTLQLAELQFSDGKFSKVNGASATANLDSATVGTISECSFAGGCLWNVDATGIGLRPEAYALTVCEVPCVYEAPATATPDSLKCRTPALPTVQSIQTWPLLAADQNWAAYPTSGVAVPADDNAAKAFDLNFDTKPAMTVGTACTPTLNLKAGWKGTISKLRFFLPETETDKLYKGGKFMVSVDGSAYTQLSEVTEIPTEGWNTFVYTSNTAYKSVRYVPKDTDTQKHLCDFIEIEVIGKLLIDDSSATEKKCPAAVTRVGETTVLKSWDDKVTYKTSATKKVTALSKSDLEPQGGEALTITLEASVTVQSVKIDGVACSLSAATGTSIPCTTGKRTAFVESSLVIETSTGYAYNNGKSLRYIYKWTDPDTWSGEYAPGDGDSIHIPKGQSLLMDADASPMLKAVLVNGALIFEPKSGDESHHRTFDAEYVYVENGRFEVGSETSPYTSKLTITMHGTTDSAKLPIYGNKVIAVRNGIIEMHGKPRSPVWTELWATAEVGAKQFTLIYDNTAGDFDWKDGDKIAVGPTNFSFKEAEELTIDGTPTTDPTTKRVTVKFKEALQYRHFAAEETYTGGKKLSMRAEVGLLTRNVKFQGDSQSKGLQYGGHIMMFSPGDESLEGRFSHIELFNVGQAFNLGRYPLHFHMIGRVTKSYIKHNSIHQTFNRATTLHGVHYLTIENNFAFDTMGHAVFIEDAAETKNNIVNNLVMKANPSNSLLNTDTSPACFWITHPDNIFIGNHCSGAMRYGFWYDLQEHAMGPSSNPNICPTGERLGVFRDNVAHSVGRYGLRIFHKHIPRTDPCGAISKAIDVSKDTAETDYETKAFEDNEPVEALYENFIGYKAGRAAVIAEEIGFVTFRNITTADNVESGIQITIPGLAKTEQGMVDGAFVVGESKGNGMGTANYNGAKGVTTGQKDTYYFKNIEIHNFAAGTETNSGVTTCSHCAFTLNKKGFANTMKWEGVSFTNVTKQLIWDQWHNQIIHDVDGKFSGDNSERWITPDNRHNKITNVCTLKESLDNSYVCTQPVRKLRFFNPKDFDELVGQKMKIAQKDDVPAPPTGETEVTWTQELVDKYSHMSQNKKKDGQWEIPFVTGQQYNVHWQYGIDWTGFSVERSRLMTAADKSIVLQFNYTDKRDEFHVTTNKAIANQTTTTAFTIGASPTQANGEHYKDDAKNLFYMIVTGKNQDKGTTAFSTATVTTVRCTGGCATTNQVDITGPAKSWADTATWPNNALPAEGQDVEIPSGVHIEYDVDTALKYKKIFVKGRLTFKEHTTASTHVQFQAQWIIVQGGELLIGSEEKAYPNKLTITLLGGPNQLGYAQDNNVAMGNKIMYVSGTLYARGVDPLVDTSGVAKPTWVRLLEKATKGTKTLKVDTGMTWKADDEIVIGPTSYDYKQGEIHKISGYDSATGVVTLVNELAHDHYGAAAHETYEVATGTSLVYDMRAEVGHLTKNVVIQGEEGERWGGQIVVQEFQNAAEVTFQGKATLKNIELRRMSQYDTSRAAIRFEGTTQASSVERCSIHRSSAWALAITNGKNIEIKENVVWETHRNAMRVEGSHMLKLKNNLFMYADKREWDTNVKRKDNQFAVDICVGESNTKCTDLQIMDNAISGGKGIGWLVPTSDCYDETNTENVFKGNSAHSLEVGLVAHVNNGLSNDKNNQNACGLIKSVTLHHNDEIGVWMMAPFRKFQIKHAVIADNEIGVSLLPANGDLYDEEFEVTHSLIIGEHAATRDCTVEQESTGMRKIGVFSTIATTGEKGLPFQYPKLGFIHVGGNAAAGNLMKFTNVVFKDFPEASKRCKAGASTFVFETHEEGSDLIMEHRFENIKFDQVDDKAFVNLIDPPTKWANLKDCVEFPCTAPENMLLSFIGELTQVYDPATSGDKLRDLPARPFDIISDNPGIPSKTGCSAADETGNFRICSGNSWALLNFESLDGDRSDRGVQPVFITTKATTGYNIKLNSFMDHVWDGFYTGQIRLSRFPTLIDTSLVATTAGENFYDVVFTGTPPLTQRYQLYGGETSKVKLRVQFKNPDAIALAVNGTNTNKQFVDKEPVALVRGVPGPLTGTECGENRWLRNERQLEFTIEADPEKCTIKLSTKNSVALSFRLDMTVDDFFNSNGASTFLSRMSAALGISTSRIRIVGVYEGSVVIESQILQDDTVTDNSSSGGASQEQQQIAEIQAISEAVQSLSNAGTLLGDWNVLDTSVQVNTYEGGVVSIDIPVIQPDTSISVTTLVLIGIGGLFVVTSLLFVTMILINKKKMKNRLGMQRVPERDSFESSHKVAPSDNIISQNLHNISSAF